MTLKTIFKVTTLLVALGATIYCMYLLNTGHSTDFLASMGLGTKSQTLNWCSNRLTKMEGSNSQSPWLLEEREQKWMISLNGETPKAVEYLDIEKWLAKYCILNIRVLRGEAILDQHLAPFAQATFNDGTSAKIYLLGEKGFQINEVIFASDEMKSAVTELKNILKF